MVCARSELPLVLEASLEEGLSRINTLLLMMIRELLAKTLILHDVLVRFDEAPLRLLTRVLFGGDLHEWLDVEVDEETAAADMDLFVLNSVLIHQFNLG